ncbi:MAG: EpsG family protein [Bacteroidaceae bacterium]|nr:EpsG family protein [Bacteroidaceae bacterium]
MLVLPYLLIMIFLCGCAFFHEFTSDENRKMQIRYVAIGVFSVFFVFRGYINTDWVGYYPFFETLEWKDLFTWSFDAEKDAHVEEPGFVLLALICKTIIPHYLFLQVVVSALCMWLFFRFLNKMKIENYSLVFMLFISFAGMGIVFNLLRNSLAIFIFLNALEYLVDRKPLHYFGLCLLAVSFHMTSLVFLPLYFFFHFRINRWVFLGCFSVFAAMYLLNISIVVSILQILGIDELLTAKVEAYTEVMNASRSGFSLGFIERVLTAVLVTLYYDKLNMRRKNNAIIINGLLCYFFMFFCLAEFSTISSRMSNLFVYSYWIIWVDLLYCLYYENNRNIFLAFIMLYCMVKLLPVIQKPVQEYDNILFGIKGYEERLNIFHSTFVDDNE